MIHNKRFIYDLSYTQIKDLVIDLGEPGYRADQIWHGLYQQHWNNWEQFTSLPARFRSRLESDILVTSLRPTTTIESTDGETLKTLFQLHDGTAIEAVIMRYNKRRTLCISTQAGCAMGCVFCATGQMGLNRNLSSGEIIEQVMYYSRQLHRDDERVTNIVIMGMGEPFHNYNETMHAIERLNDKDGYNFGARRFTISTVGLVPMIKRFSSEKHQINLAISLHAVDNKLRTSLLPVNRKYPVDVLLESCREYVQLTGRRITFEWALIRGLNDSVNQAEELARKLKLFRSGGPNLYHVNLIPLNPTYGYSGERTTRNQAILFRDQLTKAGISCTIRVRRGIDIQAGCGQLAINN